MDNICYIFFAIILLIVVKLLQSLRLVEFFVDFLFRSLVFAIARSNLALEEGSKS